MKTKNIRVINNKDYLYKFIQWNKNNIEKYEIRPHYQHGMKAYRLIYIKIDETKEDIDVSYRKGV